MEITDWANLTDEELLEKKIAHLGLKLEGTELDPLIKQLYDELTLKGLAFHPKCHVGDEWFVPVGIPAIFVPFFSNARAVAKTGAQDDVGGRRRNTEVVHETNSP